MYLWILLTSLNFIVFVDPFPIRDGQMSMFLYVAGWL